MSHRKNKNFHVVKGSKERTDKRIKRATRAFGENDWREEELQFANNKRKRRKRALAGMSSIFALAAAWYLLIHLQTYTAVSISDTYPNIGAQNGSYEQFAGGVLKYSRDGISYLNQKGEEQWNQPYQIKNPFVEGNDTSAAVADKGGNDIFVFQKDGVKGEIHTTLPIQRISVSEQGIVCAVLKNESTPQIVCYDTAGNILVEHKTSSSGTGYPMDASISPDGEVMQVVYLNTQDGKIISKVAYYNFGKEGEGATDRQVAEKEYGDIVVAEGFFMSQNVSAAVGDNMLVIYKGEEAPEEEVSIEIDKVIKSVFHNDRYIGMVLQNKGKGGYELRLYNRAGKQVMSEDFTGDYSNVELYGSQVVMYDGKQCSIFMRNGIQKFKGEMPHHILEIFPVAGINKYIVMNANGMEHVRLVK